MILPLIASCSKKESDAEEKKAEKHNANIVTLTKANLEHATIKMEVAARGALSTTMRAPGRVSANLNKTAKIVSTLEGRVTKLNVDLNDRVKAGDVLGTVDVPELIGKPLELKAPIDGVVMERKATAGELVDKTKEIYTISDPAQVWVLADVKERDTGAVKVGQGATFTVLAFPGEPFHGKVVRVGNEIEKESRTLEARIEVDNRDGRLKPGMFADVEITTDVMRDVLIIPDSALQTSEDQQIVFAALSDTKFEKRAVKLGLERQGKVQVVEGIKEGEKIVTEGSFILKSETLKGEMGEE